MAAEVNFLAKSPAAKLGVTFAADRLGKYSMAIEDLADWLFGPLPGTSQSAGVTATRVSLKMPLKKDFERVMSVAAPPLMQLRVQTSPRKVFPSISEGVVSQFASYGLKTRRIASSQLGISLIPLSSRLTVSVAQRTRRGVSMLIRQIELYSKPNRQSSDLGSKTQPT